MNDQEMPTNCSAYTIPEWLPENLLQSSRTVTLEAGETVFVFGARPVSMDFVLSGEIHMLRYTPSGSQILLHRSCGGFIAEASIDIATYPCDAVAVSNSTLVRFELKQFQEALEFSAEFRSAWNRMLAREIRRLRTQCERLALHTAQARIAHYIECEGRDGVLELPSTLKSWAHELGLSHEALYRELSKLKSQKVLQMEGRRLHWLGTKLQNSC
jgi:CRP-like cAMP-binding protein